MPSRHRNRRGRSRERQDSLEKRLKKLERSMRRRRCSSGRRSREKRDREGRHDRDRSRSSSDRRRGNLSEDRRSRSLQRELSAGGSLPSSPISGDSIEEEEKGELIELPEKQLEEEVLQWLGGEQKDDRVSAAPLQKDLARRWESVLRKGLDTEVKAELLKKYPPPENCLLAQTPKVNVEVKAAVGEKDLKRDERLAVLQGQMGVCLFALGEVLSAALDDSVPLDRIKLIEKLSDAGRLLADLHHSKSETRRWILSTNLNQKYKDAFADSHVDGWLFGEGLTERLQAAKTLEKSTVDLKVQKLASGKKNLNSKPPVKFQPPVAGRKNERGGGTYRQLPIKNYRNQHRGGFSSHLNRTNYTQKSSNQSRRSPKSPRRRY